MRLSLIKKLIILAVALGMTILIAAFISKNLYRTKAAQPKVNITMTPKTGPIAQGEEKDITLIIQPETPPVGGNITYTVSGINLVFNTSGLDIVDVSTPDSFPPQVGGLTPLFTEVMKNVTANNAQIVYTAKVPDNQLPTAVELSVRVRGNNPSGAANSYLTIDTTQSQIVGNITGQVYDFGTVDQGVFTTSGAPGGTGNTSLNLRVRFQGITNANIHVPSDCQNTQITIAGASLPTPITTTACLTVNSNGIWSGTAKFDLPGSPDLNARYSVYIKGPKQLQKRICDVAPTEGTPGSYHCATHGIPLNANADNSLDTSGVYQLSGDIPVPDHQDGIIDSQDTTYIREHFGSTDPTVLSKADLNLDGIIDSQDFSLVIAALSIKYDDPIAR